MFERGALVLVPYPFTDLSARKRRPVLALTAPDSQGDFIGMPVTSRASQPSGLALDSRLRQGALPKPSWVRTDRVVTLSASLVIKSVGLAHESLLAEAVSSLCHHLGMEKQP